MRNRTTDGRLSLEQNERDVVERFRAIMGVGSIRRHRNQWMWRTRSCSESTPALMLMLPWMGVRRTNQMLPLIDKLFSM